MPMLLDTRIKNYGNTDFLKKDLKVMGFYDRIKSIRNYKKTKLNQL